MTVFRIITLVLAVLQVLLTIYTAIFGAFAYGGDVWAQLDVWARLWVFALHPLCAVAILVLTLLPRPSPPIAYTVGTLLLTNIVADLTVALLNATGAIGGDWWPALTTSVVPALGLAYALTLAKQGRNAPTQPAA